MIKHGDIVRCPIVAPQDTPLGLKPEPFASKDDMPMFDRRRFVIAAALCAIAITAARAEAPADPLLHAAVTSPTRPAAASARDIYRHPEASLRFWGLKPGATVIDVGTNRLDSREEVARIFRNSPEKLASFDKRGSVLVGDVHPLDVAEKASAYTPVPGGVGPLTIAMLMVNTVASAERRAGIC